MTGHFTKLDKALAPLPHLVCFAMKSNSNLAVIRTLAVKGRMVFSFDAIGFIMGLGYVMGLRSAMVFCAGSILTSFVLVPTIWFIGSHTDIALYPAMMPISKMTAVEIYRNYVRFIGVGEGIDDLQPFNADEFVDALLG